MHVRVDPRLTLMEKVLRMQDEGIGKEWGVKRIKSKRDDGHGNTEFLVEWDGNWVDTWLGFNLKRTLRSLCGCISSDLD